ncbi:MAG: GIY-YIG nuclease family protein [Citrobacter portucalensis]|nr:GIY-YIG nuclease family protein [Citrobacter portucalensis]
MKLTQVCQSQASTKLRGLQLFGVAMRKLTTEQFIEKAIAKHGDKYDYSQSVYVRGKQKVIITCKEHGDFEQTPNNHMWGFGCDKCGKVKKGISRRVKHDDFVAKAIAVHGGVYDYSKTQYNKMCDQVVIICAEHGEFLQSPHKHLSGHGCHECGGSRKRTIIEVIDKFTDVHGDTYDYSHVDLSSTKEKVKIKCKQHGFFFQSPINHSRGQGCPSCASYGFSRFRDAFVYFLLSMDLRFMKIGITHDEKTRLSRLKSNTPFEFFVMKIIPMIGSGAQDMERHFHLSNKSANFCGFDGCTEWVVSTVDLIEEVKGL